MSTATEISTKALKRINVIASDETPSAADVSDGTDALNAMIASWEAEGLTGDVLPLDGRFEKAVTDLLAVQLCDFYGKQPSAILMRDADRGWSQIQAAFLATPEASFDPALIGTTYRRQTGGNQNYLPWQGSTDYELRDFRINGANIYECIVAGTSAATGGPSSTSSDITDGTVHWCWRMVSG
jgi:hypothetical protein